MKLLTFLALFFAVVSLDLLDQNKTAGAVFFGTVSAVITVVLFSISKRKQS